jgi:hypothetical protein
MKRKRKMLQLVRTPKAVRSAYLWILRDKDVLNVGFSEKESAPLPDWYISLAKQDVETLLTHLCAFLMDKETEEIETLTSEIVADLQTKQSTEYH